MNQLVVLDTNVVSAAIRGDWPPAAAVAVAAGSMRAAREAAGRPLSVSDAQIAGIARTNDACVATRNSRDFVDLDVDVINPWHLR